MFFSRRTETVTGRIRFKHRRQCDFSSRAKTDERSTHSRGGSSRLSLLRLVILLSGLILAIWFIIRRLGRWRRH